MVRFALRCRIPPWLATVAALLAGAAASAGLNLQAGASYSNLVNVMATSEPVVRVIPSDADGSYLVVKLESRQTVGASMPLGGQPLDQTDITNIRNWITQGANNN